MIEDLLTVRGNGGEGRGALNVLALLLRRCHGLVNGSRRRRRIEENSLEIANADEVVPFPGHARADELVVDRGAIAREHVLDVPLLLLAQQPGVLAADGRRGDGNVAIGAAAEDDRILVERETVAGVCSLANHQERHGTTSTGAKRFGMAGHRSDCGSGMLAARSILAAGTGVRNQALIENREGTARPRKKDQFPLRPKHTSVISSCWLRPLACCLTILTMRSPRALGECNPSWSAVYTALRWS